HRHPVLNEMVDVFLDRLANGRKVVALYDHDGTRVPRHRVDDVRTRDRRSERLPQLHLEGDRIKLLTWDPHAVHVHVEIRLGLAGILVLRPVHGHTSRTEASYDLRLNRPARQSVMFEILLEA